jgi:hypothetical protein
VTDTTPPDPRIGQLVTVIQVLTQKYVDLATSVHDKLDPDVAAELRTMVRDVTSGVYSSIHEIAGATPPRVDPVNRVRTR